MKDFLGLCKWVWGHRKDIAILFGGLLLMIVLAVSMVAYHGSQLTRNSNFFSFIMKILLSNWLPVTLLVFLGVFSLMVKEYVHDHKIWELLQSIGKLKKEKGEVEGYYKKTKAELSRVLNEANGNVRKFNRVVEEKIRDAQSAIKEKDILVEKFEQEKKKVEELSLKNKELDKLADSTARNNAELRLQLEEATAMLQEQGESGEEDDINKNEPVFKRVE